MERNKAQQEASPKGKAQLWWKGFAFHVLVLAILFFLAHIPTLQLGRIRDDIYVLSKCENYSWEKLLLEGFHFPREDFGNPWWIEKKDIAHFFRPLVLASFKLPIEFFGDCDLLHRSSNLLIHLASCTLLIIIGRRLFCTSTAAYLAAFYYAFTLHNQWTVMWMVARKELLVGFLLLLAFYFHLRQRSYCTLATLLLAMTAGEHAVAFPFLIVVWDSLSPLSSYPKDSSSLKSHLARVVRERWKLWSSYLGLLLAYILIRHLMLGGMPLPPSPYFTHPLEPGAFSFYLLKKLLFASALTIQVLFIDRPVMTLWLDHPSLLVLSIVLSLAVLIWAYYTAKNKALYLTLLAMSLVAFLPFTPMVAMPIYLYSPLLFFCLAFGAALDGVLLLPTHERSQSQRGLLFAVMAVITLHFVGTFVWTWGRFNEKFHYPKEVLPLILEEIGDRERVFLIDMPPHALPLPHLIQESLNRPGKDIAVLSLHVPQKIGDHARIERIDKRSFRVKNKANPYFETPTERALAFVPNNSIREGRVIDRGWYEIELEELSPAPAKAERGKRFFTKEGGVKSLLLRLKEGSPKPAVIAFRNQRPHRIEKIFKGPVSQEHR